MRSGFSDGRASASLLRGRGLAHRNRVWKRGNEQTRRIGSLGRPGGSIWMWGCRMQMGCVNAPRIRRTSANGEYLNHGSAVRPRFPSPSALSLARSCADAVSGRDAEGAMDRLTHGTCQCRVADTRRDTGQQHKQGFSSLSHPPARRDFGEGSALELAVAASSSRCSDPEGCGRCGGGQLGQKVNRGGHTTIRKERVILTPRGKLSANASGSGRVSFLFAPKSRATRGGELGRR